MARYDLWEIVPRVVETLKPEKLEAAIQAVKKIQQKIGSTGIRKALSLSSGITLNAHFKDSDGTLHKLAVKDAMIGDEMNGRTQVSCSDILIDGKSIVKGLSEA